MLLANYHLADVARARLAERDKQRNKKETRS